MFVSHDPNIQYQHRKLTDPTDQELSDMGTLGFSITAVWGVTVYMSRPRPCTVCGGTRRSKNPDRMNCEHCDQTAGVEPIEVAPRELKTSRELGQSSIASLTCDHYGSVATYGKQAYCTKCGAILTSEED